MIEEIQVGREASFRKNLNLFYKYIRFLCVCLYMMIFLWVWIVKKEKQPHWNSHCLENNFRERDRWKHFQTKFYVDGLGLFIRYMLHCFEVVKIKRSNRGFYHILNISQGLFQMIVSLMLYSHVASITMVFLIIPWGETAWQSHLFKLSVGEMSTHLW